MVCFGVVVLWDGAVVLKLLDESGVVLVVCFPGMLVWVVGFCVVYLVFACVASGRVCDLWISVAIAWCWLVVVTVVWFGVCFVGVWLGLLLLVL